MKSFAVKTIRFFSAAAVALLFSLSSGAAFAYAAPAPGTAPDEANLSNHNTYTNRDGNTVHAPARALSRRHLQLQQTPQRHMLPARRRR